MDRKTLDLITELLKRIESESFINDFVANSDEVLKKRKEYSRIIQILLSVYRDDVKNIEHNLLDSQPSNI